MRRRCSSRIRLTIGAIVIALVASGCVVLSAPVVFGVTLDSASGEQLLDVGLADVTGDGLDDVLVLTTNRLIRLAPCGAGCFANRQTITFVKAHGMDTGDVDGDGIDDVVVAVGLWYFEDDDAETYPGAVEIYYGGAAAAGRRKGLVAGDMASVPSSGFFDEPPFDVRLSDLNGDDVLDVVVAEDDGYGWHPGDGAGSFGSRSSIVSAPAAGEAVGSTVLADVDGDGDTELVIIALSALQGFISLFVFDVAPAGRVDSFTLTSAPWTGVMGAGDLTGDGIDDLVGRATAGLRVMRSTGTKFVDVKAGTFHPVAATVTEMIVDDFDDDNRADVVTIDRSAKVVSWWHGNRAGGFFKPYGVERFDRAIAANAQAMAAGDVDGDGLPDVLVGHSGGGLSLLTNNSLVAG